MDMYSTNIVGKYCRRIPFGSDSKELNDLLIRWSTVAAVKGAYSDVHAERRDLLLPWPRLARQAHRDPEGAA